VLLVHGGLWEAGMDAERFWAAPGIIAGLQQRGFQVLAPTGRLARPAGHPRPTSSRQPCPTGR
jgi:hypothetical protein